MLKLNEQGVITDFIEKPQTFISDLAIIGIYYFKDGEYLKNEMQYLIDNNIKEKGEYQLTNALENMKTKGTKFVPGKVMNGWIAEIKMLPFIQTNVFSTLIRTPENSFIR